MLLLACGLHCHLSLQHVLPSLLRLLVLLLACLSLRSCVCCVSVVSWAAACILGHAGAFPKRPCNTACRRSAGRRQEMHSLSSPRTARWEGSTRFAPASCCRAAFFTSAPDPPIRWFGSLCVPAAIGSPLGLGCWPASAWSPACPRPLRAHLPTIPACSPRCTTGMARS